MQNSIFMSIKEIHMNRILNREKNHEFRTKIPKVKIDYIIVYIPTPVKELKYILKVKNPIVTPNKIEIHGYGNDKFNNENKLKYAYPIEHVYELKNVIGLQELKDNYNFTAPQSFAYAEKYSRLLYEIDKKGYKKIY